MHIRSPRGRKLSMGLVGVVSAFGIVFATGTSVQALASKGSSDQYSVCAARAYWEYPNYWVSNLTSKSNKCAAVQIQIKSYVGGGQYVWYVGAQSSTRSSVTVTGTVQGGQVRLKKQGGNWGGWFTLAAG